MKDPDNSTSSSRKTAQSKAPADQPVMCPRCDSPNTKFCYYNNYSLTQPRHFCKTCRRYWTKGGALRNVPIGGGCRKTKKVKSSLRIPGSDSKNPGSSNPDIGGFRFFTGLSPAQFGVFDQQPRSLSSFTGLQSHQLPSAGFHGVNVNTSLASSIESLSSINQDLHWRLQQQRLMVFGGGDGGVSSSAALEDHRPKLQPIPFQNLEISSDVSARKDNVGGGDSAAADQWFFPNSYAAAAAPTQIGGGGFDGVQEWSDLHQYTELP